MTAPRPRQRGRLRVLRTPRRVPRGAAHAQDCSKCRHIVNCWAHTIDDRLVATNLLVCRIHTMTGPPRDRAAKLLLEMLSPKVQDLVAKIIGKVHEPRDHIVADVQSMIMERLVRSYRIPGIGYPLHYLFGPRGVVYWDVLAYLRNHGVDTNTLSLEALMAKDDEGGASGTVPAILANRLEDTTTPTPLEALEQTEQHQAYDRILAIVDDGRTLTTAEYRILRYILSTADESGRPSSGALGEVAVRMGLTKQQATKVYQRASRQLREAVEAN